MKYNEYHVQFVRWVEDDDCSLECTFHFANEKGAQEFLKKRHVGVDSKSGKIWKFLAEGTSFGDNTEESPTQLG